MLLSSLSAAAFSAVGEAGLSNQHRRTGGVRVPWSWKGLPGGCKSSTNLERLAIQNLTSLRISCKRCQKKVDFTNPSTRSDSIQWGYILHPHRRPRNMVCGWCGMGAVGFCSSASTLVITSHGNPAFHFSGQEGLMEEASTVITTFLQNPPILGMQTMNLLQQFAWKLLSIGTAVHRQEHLLPL